MWRPLLKFIKSIIKRPELKPDRELEEARERLNLLELRTGVQQRRETTRDC